MTVWILAGNYISFTIEAGLIETERLRLRQVYSTQHDIIQMHDIRHT